jgi:hypothetical protein
VRSRGSAPAVSGQWLIATLSSHCARACERASSTSESTRSLLGVREDVLQALVVLFDLELVAAAHRGRELGLLSVIADVGRMSGSSWNFGGDLR